MSDYTMIESEASRTVSRNPELRTFKDSDETFERLKNQLASINIDGTVFYIAEADLLLDEDELFFYARRRSATLQKYHDDKLIGGRNTGDAEAAGASPQLVGIERNGRVVRWEPGTVLTYCVLKNTFLNADNYELLVRSMREASEAWENVCGVTFAHITELDGSNSVRPEGVLFPVREISVESDMLASAFFPIDPPGRRRVLINRSTYYSTSFNKVGVLRHELGHVLGFRHEHIRSGAPAACPNEDEFGTIPLTEYDPRSVMHYFCGRSGSKELELTEIDIAGAVRVYGPPLSSMELINPRIEEMAHATISTEDVVSYSRDIKPKFRQRDRDAMILFKNFDLWAYDDVVEWSDRILETLRNGEMPCDKPWEDEEVALFTKWIDDEMNP